MSYAPPPLNSRALVQALQAAYPSHCTHQEKLLEMLVEEYKRFWRLILNYPHQRIVGTGPIIAVWRIHSADRDGFREDCMAYFNRFIWWRDVAWRGTHDVRGIVDTCRSYERLFDEPVVPVWNEMMSLYAGIGRLQAVSAT